MVLAAGKSSRFGSAPKLAANFGGRALLQRACDAVLLSRIDRAVVVLGAHVQQLRRYCTDAALEVIENPDYELGQSSSLRRGLDAVPDNVPGCLFLAADQPLLEAAHINRVLDLGTSSDKAVQAASNSGQRGTPVYFPRRYFPLLRATAGDEGGRQVLRSLPDQDVVLATLPGKALIDIDTLSDWNAIKEN